MTPLVRGGVMLTELLTALGITGKHLVSKSITVRYPEERREVFPRVRWRHKLMRHENGLERCIGCSRGEAACPAHCIRVVADENNRCTFQVHFHVSSIYGA